MPQLQNPELLTEQIVRDPGSPWLDKGYAALNAYFGPLGEMETRQVIEQRLARNAASSRGGFSFLYELVILADSEGEVAAVRDHSAILFIDDIQTRAQPAVVHLSHIWIAPKWQGRKLAQRLHSHPIDAAREALTKAGLPAQTRIVLAAEVEHWKADDKVRIDRLRLFKMAGYRPVDPAVIPYVQPDFREPATIDASGGPKPLPLILMLWRVGREQETSLQTGEVRHIVRCLYAMYAQGMRTQHMKPVYDSIDQYPAGDISVSLAWDSVFKP